jgi:hypothetical protein
MKKKKVTIRRFITKKLVAKKVIKQTKPTLTLKERHPENAWAKQNMYFKEFLEQ